MVSFLLHSFGSYDDTVDRVLRLTGSCTGSESQLLACPQVMGREDDAVERRGFVPVSVNQSSECGPGQDEVSLHCGKFREKQASK